MERYTVSYQSRGHSDYTGSITFTFANGVVNVETTGNPYWLRYDVYKTQDGDSVDVILRDSINMEPGWIDIMIGQLSQNGWRVRNYESTNHLIKWDHLVG